MLNLIIMFKYRKGTDAYLEKYNAHIDNVPDGNTADSYIRGELIHVLQNEGGRAVHHRGTKVRIGPLAGYCATSQFEEEASDGIMTTMYAVSGDTPQAPLLPDYAWKLVADWRKETTASSANPTIVACVEMAQIPTVAY